MGVSALGDGVGVANGGSATRRAGAGPAGTEDQLFDALCQNFGVLACAALSVGLTLASLVQRVARSKRLRAGRDGARSVLVQKASERLQWAVSAGEAWALQFCARAGVQTGVPADAGKSLALLPSASHRVAQPVRQDEPRPDLAEALSRRLVVALDCDEPWAVMYCLTHLHPEGPFFAKCRRGQQHDLWAEQLAAAPMVTESAAKPSDREVVDAKDVLERRGDAEPQLMVDANEGLDGFGEAPPVCEQIEQTSMASSAPPLSVRVADFSPQPGCQLVMAASAQADATKATCLAPPVCAGPFQRRFRLPSCGSGVGRSNFKIGAMFSRSRPSVCSPILKFEHPTPTVAAPPVCVRSADFSPQPGCQLVMAASAQADATKSTCLAPPVCACQVECRLRLSAGGSGGRVDSGERRLSATDGANFDLRYCALCHENGRVSPDQRTRAPCQRPRRGLKSTTKASAPRGRFGSSRSHDSSLSSVSSPHEKSTHASHHPRRSMMVSKSIPLCVSCPGNHCCARKHPGWQRLRAVPHDVFW